MELTASARFHLDGQLDGLSTLQMSAVQAACSKAGRARQCGLDLAWTEIARAPKHDDPYHRQHAGCDEEYLHPRLRVVAVADSERTVSSIEPDIAAKRAARSNLIVCGSDGRTGFAWAPRCRFCRAPPRSTICGNKFERFQRVAGAARWPVGGYAIIPYRPG